jgi:hypothetical protein
VAVGVALDRHDLAVVEEAVHRRARQEGIAEERRHLLDGSVRGDDQRTAPVALADDLVEVGGFVAAKRHQAEVVDDEQVRPGVLQEAPVEAPVPTRGWANIWVAPV